jgi:hypothetical protein
MKVKPCLEWNNTPFQNGRGKCPSRAFSMPYRARWPKKGYDSSISPVGVRTRIGKIKRDERPEKIHRKTEKNG